jgi:hypothetical protein
MLASGEIALAALESGYLPAMGSERKLVGGALALLLGAAIGLSACGAKKQDANEPTGTWKVRVTDASFPGRQRLADEVQLRIRVKNEDTRAIPDLAVTVDGFNQRKDSPDLADPSRPVWVVDEGPVNATTAYTNTWAVGPVPAGQTRTLVWKVAAVRAGTYSVRWRVAAGLNGKAKAAEDGQPPTGQFIARVSDKPHPVKID